MRSRRISPRADGPVGGGGITFETPPGFQEGTPPTSAPTAPAATAADFPILTDQTKPSRALDDWWNRATDRMDAAQDKVPPATTPKPGEGGGGTKEGGTAYTTLDDVNVTPTDQPQPHFDPTPSALLWLRQIRLVVYGGTGQNILSSQLPLASDPTQSYLPEFLKPTLGYSMPRQDPNSIAPSRAGRQQSGGVSETGQQLRGPATSGGIDLSQLRVVFSLKKMVNGTPNILYAKIYNLSKETIERVKQYHRVQLAAGYKSNFGMIFDGSVVLYIIGRDNPVDTYLEIFAGDWDPAMNSNSVALTWPPNTTPKQKAEDMIRDGGMTAGHIDVGNNTQPSLRSSTFIGMARDGLRDIINASQADLLVDNGVAHIIPWAGYMPGEILELSPSSGLINIPKVTPDGVEAQCLLNPKLRLGGLFKLDSKWLSNVPFEPGSSKPYASILGKFPETGNVSKPFGSISPVGIYKVAFLNHSGDSRGNPWYSDLIGIAAGADGKLLEGVQSTAFQRGSFVGGPPKNG